MSQSLAQRVFPNEDALNHHVMWTDPILQFAPGMHSQSRRIIGVMPDVDNANLLPKATMTFYHPFDQEQFMGRGRFLVHARSAPYALVQPITRIVHKLSADQLVENANTLEDIRAQVLSPERLNGGVIRCVC